MSSGGESGHLHQQPDGSPITTTVHGYRYFFTDKHHGRGARGDARWAESLSEAEEFGIFNLADEHDLSDESGNLYGLWVEKSRSGPPHQIREPGTREEQMAKFWRPHGDDPWHGFPLWPLTDPDTPNRAKQEFRPDKAVFRKMESEGLLTAVQVKRLQKGRQA